MRLCVLGSGCGSLIDRGNGFRRLEEVNLAKPMADVTGTLPRLTRWVASTLSMLLPMPLPIHPEAVRGRARSVQRRP